MPRIITSALLSVGSVEFEVEFDKLVIEYSYSPAYKATSSEPGAGEDADVVAVYVLNKDGSQDPLPTWLINAMYVDLRNLCLREHDHGDDSDHRYEEQRDFLGEAVDPRVASF